MKIDLQEISIREVVQGYIDNDEEGVVGYNGRLNIRPKYQREFVYDSNKRDAVIQTIKNGFPLNVMYWVISEDGNYEVLDGQQRTVSFCQYISGDFSLDNRAFHNLTNVEKNQILDYKLMIYFCEGNDKEKLDWFKIINIAGEKLEDQELRNAVYTGSWLTHAKSIFSKSNCAAYNLSKDYVTGSPIRQKVLETAISWINDGEIEQYMSLHQHDPNANQLWSFYQNVINWVNSTFTDYRKEMKGINWGELYKVYKDTMYDTNKIEVETKILMMDDDVTKKKGIYPYILSRKEIHLNIRAFSTSQKREAYERQSGVCTVCNEHFDINDMEADHIDPWYEGGKTNADNCQMLCKEDNRRKSGK